MPHQVLQSLKAVAISFTVALHFSAAWAGDNSTISINKSTMSAASIPENLKPKSFLQTYYLNNGIEQQPQTQLDKAFKIYKDLELEKQRARSIKKITATKNLKSSLQGGVDSGGGTYIEVNRGLKGEYKGLLDFYNFSPSRPKHFEKIRFFSDSSQFCPFTQIKFSELAPENLKNSILDILSPLLVSSSSNYLAGQNLEQNLAQLTIDKFSFVLYDGDLPMTLADSTAYIHPSNDVVTTTRPVAIYIEGRGLIISRTAFDKLSGTEQYALLVHEVLRQISIGYELYFSDEDLQKITSSLFDESTDHSFNKFYNDFTKTSLPAYFFKGPFTEYFVRSVFNDICATTTAIADENKEGQVCKEFAEAEIGHVYDVIPALHQELIKAYEVSEKSADEQDKMWQKLLMSGYHSILLKSNRYANLLEYRGLNQAVGKKSQECTDLGNYLKSQLEVTKTSP